MLEGAAGTAPGVLPAALALGGHPGSPCPPLCFSLPALKWVATLNVGYGGAHASYYHRANEQVSERPPCVPVPRVSPLPPGPDVFGSPQVQVGVELEANTRLQDTTFAFGYQLNLPQANMVFRGERGAVLAPRHPPAPARSSPRPPRRAPGQ